MTKQDWKDLEFLSGLPRKKMFPCDKKKYKELLKKTEEVREHPEDFEGHCFCQLCMSYGD